MSKITEMDESTAQTALLTALQNKNLDEFESILKFKNENGININYLYKEAGDKTLLDIACSSNNTAGYVYHLLENGADVNLFNHSHGAAPIHFAVLNSNLDTIKLLLAEKATNIYQPDISGKTVFHLAAEQKQKNIIKLLTIRRTMDAQLRDRRKIGDYYGFISTYDWDLDKSFEIFEIKRRISFRPVKGSRSHHIPTNCEDSESKTAPNSDESLCSVLFQKNYEAFASMVNENDINVIAEKFVLRTTDTLLVYVCKFGLTKFVEHLLKLNVDPNGISKFHESVFPIEMAAFNGYYKIVDLLLETGIITIRSKILHDIMNGFCCSENSNLDDRDHAKCLELILSSTPDNFLTEDFLDDMDTALHYAIAMDNRDLIRLLIERGAFIGATNSSGEVAVKMMKPATLEYFLNASTFKFGCNYDELYLRFNCSFEKLDNLEGFNYNFLAYRQQNIRTNETQLLVALSKIPKLKPYLRHPFFLVFLDFKWHVYYMNTLFYTNLIFYILFVVMLSIYIFDYVSPENDKMLASPFRVALYVIIFMSNTIMLLKEFTQLGIYSAANKYRYIKDTQNWMEIILILMTYVILSDKIQSNEKRSSIAAVALFLSYVELILLILSHPRLSVNIKMFKAVAWNSMKFLAPYLILILAFSLSFCIQLRDTFKNIPQAVFKTVVMSAGEYQASSTLKNDNYVIGHLIFILFIFLITIVLFNLLNAIAVGDIRKIRKDAELVSIEARVEQIAHMEDFVLDLFSLLDRLANYYRNMCSRFRRDSKSYKHSCVSKLLEYFSNFVKISYHENITCMPDGSCENWQKTLKFRLFPATVRAIQEKLLTEDKNKKKVDPDDTYAEVIKDAAALQNIHQTQLTLKNSLEQSEKRLQSIEQKLMELTKLLDPKV
ncbi:hypothetical protein V9T40_000733 [Parthenolecanium corni]|uniref:Ion transport domain-containing protein n=1 Tax=Parthenolecanium corni TaxID=536013 RepID=A0AAN9TDH8_9HEMI